MAELQGYATFPGVQQVLHATYTRSHGISPGVCTMEIAPQPAPISTKPGLLTFFFGTLQLKFRDCIIDQSSLQASESGYVTTLHIFDRRWKWAYGEIFGEYNRRDGDGKILASIEENEKTPYGLARLLLKAMGEPESEGNKLPIEGRPYVKWEGVNPARELAQLCEHFGYSIALDVQDNLRIVKLGNGADLPNNPLVMHFGTGLDRPEPPDVIRPFGERTRFQAWLKLEAVGLDTDGIVKPIDDLSYKPSAGWEKEEATYPNLQSASQRDAKRHAMATVWRWFRVRFKEQSGEPDALRPPTVEFPEFPEGAPGKLFQDEHLQRILPISGELVQIETLNKMVRRRQANVYGIYAVTRDGDPFNSDEQPDRNTTPITYTTLTTHPKNIVYEGEFEILEQFGIVVFPRRVRKWNRASSVWAAPELWLQCSFNYRDWKKADNSHHRYSYDLWLVSKKARPLVEPVPAQDRLQWQVYQEISPGRNQPFWTYIIGREQSDLDEDAKRIADASRSKYQNVSSSDATYAGLLSVSCDGAIRQVTISVGPDGATTQISRNTESNPLVPHFRERRFFETMRSLDVDAKAQLPPIPELEKVL